MDRQWMLVTSNHVDEGWGCAQSRRIIPAMEDKVDELSIGPVPCNEDCQQLGPNYDPVRARQECRSYIAQLRRIHGEEPAGARLRVKSNPHDFGTYLEVVVAYNEDVEAAAAYAHKVEADCPVEWDEAARAELGLNGA